MFSVNVTGRLGGDAEVRDVGDSKVLAFRMAVPGRNKGEEVTTWCNVNYWTKAAEKLATFMPKGREVTVRGEMIVREYLANNQSRYSLEVRADNVQLVGGSKQDGAAAHAKTHASNTAEDSGNGSGGGSDDDIPFATSEEIASIAIMAVTPKWERF